MIQNFCGVECRLSEMLSYDESVSKNIRIGLSGRHKKARKDEICDNDPNCQSITNGNHWLLELITERGRVGRRCARQRRCVDFHRFSFHFIAFYTFLKKNASQTHSLQCLYENHQNDFFITSNKIFFAVVYSPNFMIYSYFYLKKFIWKNLGKNENFRHSLVLA